MCRQMLLRSLPSRAESTEPNTTRAEPDTARAESATRANSAIADATFAP